VVAGVFALAVGGPIAYFLVNRAVRRHLARGRALPLPSSGGPPSPGEVLRLSSEAIAELSTDPSSAVVCDWREDPEDVIHIVNGFVPPSLRLSPLAAGEGLAITTRSGHVLISAAQLSVSGEQGGVLAVIGAINTLIAPSHELRLFRCSQVGDSFSFLLATSEAWANATVQAPRKLARHFAPVSLEGVV